MGLEKHHNENKDFTEKEMKALLKNPNVKAVSSKGITYTDEFKRYFIDHEAGKLPREIFLIKRLLVRIVCRQPVKDGAQPIEIMA